MATAVLSSLLSCPLLTPPAAAQPRLFSLRAPTDGDVQPLPPGAVLTDCRYDVRYFRSLATGVTDYCRGHLRYTPGKLDCYQFAEQVCSVFVPQTGEWFSTRQPGGPAVFPCPDAPEPPVCQRLGWP